MLPKHGQVEYIMNTITGTYRSWTFTLGGYLTKIKITSEKYFLHKHSRKNSYNKPKQNLWDFFLLKKQKMRTLWQKLHSEGVSIKRN